MTRTIDFSDLGGMQDRTAAYAINNHKEWSNEDIAYLAANMFDMSIEALAKHLGRTAVAVATVFNKDPDFIAIREENGATIHGRNGGSTTTKPEGRDNRIVTSDCDLLFNFGD